MECLESLMEFVEIFKEKLMKCLESLMEFVGIFKEKLKEIERLMELLGIR